MAIDLGSLIGAGISAVGSVTTTALNNKSAQKLADANQRALDTQASIAAQQAEIAKLNAYTTSQNNTQDNDSGGVSTNTILIIIGVAVLGIVAYVVIKKQNQ